jgi:hypothetical protein
MDEVELEVRHLARHGSSARPLPGATLLTKCGRQSTEGYIHDGRLIGRGARNQEPDGNRDTRHKIYTTSDRQHGVKPYILCSVILY